MSATTQNILAGYKGEIKDELFRILQFWQQHTLDTVNGGFWGAVNNSNQPNAAAEKGVVLHARILWTFAAAYKFTTDSAHLAIAERAFQYLLRHFSDEEYGGVYWSVDARGNPLKTRKQVYGVAFAIYGMSEYAGAANNATALAFAKALYHTIEQHSLDATHNGYFEAFARDWQPLHDVRLSSKDANASKTANTHLHIVEAYANLYKVWKDEGLRDRIENLLMLFDTYFIDPQTRHLRLFFDEKWNEQPDVISYGHDIEAAWLLLQCARNIDSNLWMTVYRKHAQSLADAALEGVDSDGGMWYEFDPVQGRLIKQKHWWPQAEAMIGFLNAWQLSGNDSYLQHSVKAWRFTQQHILDKENGEWFWGVDEACNLMQDKDKAGFWKCPYHNARACMEVMKRIDETNNKLQW